jgi:hypothetical protein
LHLGDTHFESRLVQHLFSQRFYVLLHIPFQLYVIMGLCHRHILPELCLLTTRGHLSSSTLLTTEVERALLNNLWIMTVTITIIIIFRI